MKTVKPFTWVVSFTIDPTWVADGFTLGNERALHMLAKELGGGTRQELGAKILHAPSALEIVRTQGYGPKDTRGGAVVREIFADVGETGRVWNALIKARDLLDSVAFVKTEGDTHDALDCIRDALALLDPRQGEAVELDD